MSKLSPRIIERPPRFAEWLLGHSTITPDQFSILGDYQEEYYEITRILGRRSARSWYWIEMFNSLLPFVIFMIYWRIVMFENYVKITFRKLMRHKLYSTINIVGLAVGIMCCLLILLYVQHELSYDRYHEKADRIYRITASVRFGGTDGDFAVMGSPVAEAFRNDFPEVEEAVRMRNMGSWYIRYGDQTFKEEGVLIADETLFDVFTIPLVLGDPEKVLLDPNTIILSETMADKYFGQEDPLDKTVNLDGRTDCRVTGVFADIPTNSHFHADFFVSWRTFENSVAPIWLSFNYWTYLVLKEGTDPGALEAKFPEMVKKYCGPEFQQFVGVSYEQVISVGNYIRLKLQPMTRIHLHSNLDAEIEPVGDINYVYIFSAIAFFILVIACVNFMNLSTARSANRALEVGIRKVVGSPRRILIQQFLSESLLLGGVALLFAIGMTLLILPFFNNLAAKALMIKDLLNVTMVTSLLVIVLLVGLGAGSYPAFYLSSFQPVQVIRKKLGVGSKSKGIRSGLVVFQFVTSVILIFGTLVIVKQLGYIQNKKLGFEKEQVLLIQDAFILRDQLQTFKQETQNHPDVISATVSSFLPVLPSSRNQNAVFPEGKATEETTPIQTWQVDFDYVRTFGMEIIRGRDFSREFATDSSACIINEATARHFGWEDPLGKQLGTFTSIDPPTISQYTVIGVVKDFHYLSLRNEIAPLALFIDRSTSYVAMRLNTKDLSVLIDFIRGKWETFAPGQPFDYSFVDDRFDEMYRTEQRIGKIFGVFAGLAVFIGCLGLFGLAAFTAEQRTKEIGVRKVLGASVPGIVYLLSKEFGKFVFFAFLIAAPISHLIMSRWLEDFAYRIHIGIWPYILSGLLALAIALIVVCYQAIRAALADPVKTLRYE